LVLQPPHSLVTAGELAVSYSLRLNAGMRGSAVIILLGLTALASYSLGRHDAPKVMITAAVSSPTSSNVERPLAYATLPTADAKPTRVRPDADTQAGEQSAKLPPPEKPAATEERRKAEVALTATAIAAILIRSSRDQYYATGHPCACPDDLMRNGRACGARSAYSRPGGASPKCYPTDITEGMIRDYRRSRLIEADSVGARR
jgi:hypothetical protein